MRDLGDNGNVLYLDCIRANSLAPARSLSPARWSAARAPAGSAPWGSRPLSARRVSRLPASRQPQRRPRLVRPHRLRPLPLPAQARGHDRQCPPGQFPFRAGARPLLLPASRSCQCRELSRLRRCPGPRCSSVPALSGLGAPRSPRSRASVLLGPRALGPRCSSVPALSGLGAPRSPRSRASVLLGPRALGPRCSSVPTLRASARSCSQLLRGLHTWSPSKFQRLGMVAPGRSFLGSWALLAGRRREEGSCLWAECNIPPGRAPGGTRRRNAV
ncbi:uncharacterized protein LOC116568749 [Mustela erminea]|uniref:uncharacterized protein LOC116568749 n=1 Tax=Mustela erminea TaxID=36723 RepID=UPI001386C53F|nr:uncharacterized protein LOC116568749 [Mustela erminea]